MANKCNCEICKISRGLSRLQKKYKLTKREMAPIEALWSISENDSNELGILKYYISKGTIPSWVDSPEVCKRGE